jgi:cytochrome c553
MRVSVFGFSFVGSRKYRNLAGAFLATVSIVAGQFTVVTAASEDSDAPSADQAAFFEKSVRPLIANRCASCHSTDTRSSGGLNLDNREALLRGGKSGPAIIPRKPDESLLLQRILGDHSKPRMPLGDEALTAKEISDLRTWIAEGAVWPLRTAGALPERSRDSGVAKVSYPRPATLEQLAYFEKKVRPIFVNRCYNCHSDAFKEAGGLRVDVGRAIFAGGNSGPAIVPGDPTKSTLIKRVKNTDPKKRMPQESKEGLPAEEIAILENWIRDGAAWPDETEKLPATAAHILARYQKLKANHWAWQPLENPPVPPVNKANWPVSDIDRFILAKLEEKKLAPVRDADPDTLLRRISYDLTGLPPSPADIQAFEKDHSSKAYSQLVDRLLASPQFGERWGRHWLDVARYAESSGPSRNMPYPNAWRYRDYVIEAVNRDIPFDRFIQEQIAGDLLPAATPAERDRLLIATGFLALGPKDVNQRFKARYKMDNVDDQIDTVTRSTMALTVSCARCHDHKFDPIPTKDYYSLASIFTSTDDFVGLTSRMGGSGLQYYAPQQLSYMSTAIQAPPVARDVVKNLETDVEKAKQAFEASKTNPDGSPLTEAQKKRSADLQKKYRLIQTDLDLVNDLGERGYGIHSVHDGVIGDTAIRIRGIEERHGPLAPRGVLSLVNFPGQPVIPGGQSGRVELARWITSPQNPLTPRVYANRIWQHLFGTGIVSSVDNFGSMGDQPANSALLDYLAQTLIQNGWSTKKLVRAIVLSHAYRLGTDVPPGYRDIDPADRLVWRHSPRRLEAEEVRDSLLATSGQLDLPHPDGSPSMALRMIEIRDDGPAVASILASADRSRFRSIYLPLLRGETPRQLAAFDPVVQTLVSGQRETTTVPAQSLFMLNSPFVRREASILAGRLLTPEFPNDGARIREAYQRVLGRDPKPGESARVKAFLDRYSATWDQAHPESRSSEFAKTGLVSFTPSNITAGVVRSDGLTQDQELIEPTVAKEDPSLTIVPRSASHAAWSAFVQALYGSAEFQFVR